LRQFGKDSGLLGHQPGVACGQRFVIGRLFVDEAGRFALGGEFAATDFLAVFKQAQGEAAGGCRNGKNFEGETQSCLSDFVVKLSFDFSQAGRSTPGPMRSSASAML